MHWGDKQRNFRLEPVFYAHKRKQAPEWYGDRKQTAVWKNVLIQNIPDVSIWRIAKDDAMNHYHPTQKPLSLIAIPGRNNSKHLGVVVDFFGGFRYPLYLLALYLMRRT